MITIMLMATQVITMEKDMALERGLLKLLQFMDIMRNLIMDLAMNIVMIIISKMAILVIIMAKDMTMERGQPMQHL